MKIKVYLIILLSANFICQYLQAQTDYRSNPSVFNTSGDPTGHFVGTWNTASNWETFNGISWVTAASAPSSSDGVITIQAGDSMILSAATTIDQVVVEPGGVLAIFNSGTPTVFTINDDAGGDDIIVDGHLYISIGATVSGTGTIKNNSSGLFNLWNSGILAVNTDNSGTMTVQSTGNIQNVSLTNNKTLVWTNNNINLTSASIINNDSIVIKSNAGGFINATGSCTLNNTSTGKIFKENSAGTMTIVPSMNNSGTIKGSGTFNFSAASIINTGTISPGNSISTLAVNPSFVTGKSPNIQIEVKDGSGAGNGNDLFSLTGSTDLTGSTLTIIDTNLITPAPVGTYTVMTTTAGTFSGIPSLNLPSNYSYLGIVGGNTVQVQKNALFPLPLFWGDFTIKNEQNQVRLNWTTLQENNVSYFVIEYFSNGEFTPIGTLKANNNFSAVSKYSFTHATPAFSALNTYRIKEVDFDGSYSYSPIRSINLKDQSTKVIEILGNPLGNDLQISVKQKNIRVSIIDFSGRLLQELKLDVGVHHIDVSQFSSGIYQLIIYQDRTNLGTQQFLKL